MYASPLRYAEHLTWAVDLRRILNYTIFNYVIYHSTIV
jgi:hypothetical protein